MPELATWQSHGFNKMTPEAINAGDYYRQVTGIDIGTIAHELLGQRITKSGDRTLLCDCPNHTSQSKLSLNIMIDKQGWYCFGCEVGGDVLQLVEFVQSGCVTRGHSGQMPESHRKARDFLARKIGLPPLSRVSLSPEAILELEQARQQSLRVFAGLTALAEYYHCRLVDSPEVLNWFQEKYRIGNAMIDRLKIGYSENAGWIDSEGKRHAGSIDALCAVPPSFNADELASLSAFRHNASGISPFFNRRIIFPYWSRGQVVFMIGRRTPWTPQNEFESPKYKKLPVRSDKNPHIAPCIRNDVLYNEDILATRPERIVVTEGVTDCISLMEHGFPAISPVTVQIKEADWIRVLPRLAGARTVYLCQDNELSGAGLQGAIRSAKVLIANGVATRIAVLPLGKQQFSARQQLAERFRIVEPVNASKPKLDGLTADDARLVTELIEQAKLDVNLFFAEGKTAEDFEGVLGSAQSPLEMSISRLSITTTESDLEKLLDPLIADISQLGPIEQERHLRLIQTQIGKDRISLTTLGKQLRATRPPDSHLIGRHRLASSHGGSSIVWPEPAAGSPQIVVNDRQLRAVVSETWAAIDRANQPGSPIFPRAPYLYRRGEHLVHLVGEGSEIDITHSGEGVVYALIARVADWFRVKGARMLDTLPLKEAAADMIAFPDSRLPVLESVIRTPVFACDGSLITTPGYHANARVWMEPDPKLRLGKLPMAPSEDQIRAARELFYDDLIVDFKFAQPSDRAHLMSAFLLPFVRRMIEGPTPLHLIEAPTPGTGKGLLANIVALVTTGALCASSALSTSEDEIRKTITAQLMNAPSLILLDNVDNRSQLHSSSLASVLTTVKWRDRVLGLSSMVTVTNHALWLMTANNPNLHLELARRCIRIRIDPKADKPWRRAQFKHPKLVEWAMQNRTELVEAALILVLAWIAAGRPPGKKCLGSFEGWSSVLDGILTVAGVDGFLANLDRMYDNADPSGQKWRDFTAAWWEEFRDAPTQVSTLNDLCERRGLMLELRGEKTPRSQQIRLGNGLFRHRDQFFGGLRVEQVEHESNHHGVSYYRLRME